MRQQLSRSGPQLSDHRWYGTAGSCKCRWVECSWMVGVIVPKVCSRCVTCCNIKFGGNMLEKTATRNVQDCFFLLLGRVGCDKRQICVEGWSRKEHSSVEKLFPPGRGACGRRPAEPSLSLSLFESFDPPSEWCTAVFFRAGAGPGQSVHPCQPPSRANYIRHGLLQVVSAV